MSHGETWGQLYQNEKYQYPILCWQRSDFNVRKAYWEFFFPKPQNQQLKSLINIVTLVQISSWGVLCSPAAGTRFRQRGQLRVRSRNCLEVKLIFGSEPAYVPFINSLSAQTPFFQLSNNNTCSAPCAGVYVGHYDNSTFISRQPSLGEPQHRCASGLRPGWEDRQPRADTEVRKNSKCNVLFLSSCSNKK